jgi:hypothetical protein
MASKNSWWPLSGLLFTSFKKKRKASGASVVTPFHAVSVIPGEGACEAAYRFAGQRFLSKHPPPLPLPACDAARCTCRFKHHKDRRAGPRRRSDIGVVSAPWSSPERRRVRGRRVDDS